MICSHHKHLREHVHKDAQAAPSSEGVILLYHTPSRTEGLHAIPWFLRWTDQKHAHDPSHQNTVDLYNSISHFVLHALPKRSH